MTLIKDAVKRASYDTEAYRLIYQILSTAPRTTQDVVKEGIALFPIYDPNAPSSSTAPAIASSAAAPAIGAGSSVPTTAPDPSDAAANVRARLNAMRLSQEDKKGKGRKGKRDLLSGQERTIPEEHPFHSTVHLKSRILPTLESQRLIHRRYVPITSEYPKIPGESRFRWFLTRPETQANGNEKLSFSIPDHWQRLLSGEHPQKTYHTWQRVKDARQAAQREADLAAHRIQRTEREIWTWEGRDPDMTTRLQKIHLNRRNQRRKVKEERELVARRKAKDEARALAEAEVREAASQDAEARRGEGKGRRASKPPERIEGVVEENAVEV